MKYRVFLEFDVTSTDIAEVEIEASSPEVAAIIAKDKYLYGELTDLDFYASNQFESELSENTIDWRVDEID